MNKCLPLKDELTPITNPYTTFYECGFNKPFEQLDFRQQLQVVNDLVRQSMIPDANADPQTDVDTLIGNCHTASLATIEYLNYLGIGHNIRYVLCRQRPYDPLDVVSRHTAVLVDDAEGNTYFVDSTPYVGYKFGKVEKLSECMPYKEFSVIQGESFDLLLKMREVIYKCSKGLMNADSAKKYIKYIAPSMAYPFLNGHTSQCLYYLSQYITNPQIKSKLLQKSIELDPYESLAGRDIQKCKYRKSLIIQQIIQWRHELDTLRQSHFDPQKEFELARYIYQESKLMNENLETRIDLGEPHNRISNLTPRLFIEEGVNVVMLKPSAFFTNTQDEIVQKMIPDKNKIVYSYTANLANKREMTNLRPMLLSHTVGVDFEQAMYGKSQIFLVREPAQDLYKNKKILRANLAKEFHNKDVIWYDGSIINWNPDLLNLVHSTDDASEACLHFLIAQPEQQLMTRYMYPNPLWRQVEDILYQKYGSTQPYGNQRKLEINQALDEIHGYTQWDTNTASAKQFINN